MMFNVLLPGGTTGHVVGGLLVAVLLGPWAATLAISVALFVQAMLFGGGGILAFGANVFNMAFVIPFLGYAVYTLIKDCFRSRAGEYIGLAAGSYIGIAFAALCAAIEFGIQPLLFKDAAGLPRYCRYPLSVSIPAMLLPHLVVAGVVEAAFTMAIVAFVRRVSPASVYEGASMRNKPLFALLVVLIVLSPIGLLASGTAWGEWGAEEIGGVVQGGKALGFVPAGMRSGFSLETLMPDYTIKGVPAVAGHILSAIAGVAVLVIAFKLLGLAKRAKPVKAEN